MQYLLAVLSISVCVLFCDAVESMDKVTTIKCLVCKNLVDEIEHVISKVNPKKTVQMGSYRIDSNGNNNKNEVPYARSELHLMELLENVCSNFKDYALGTYKASGHPTLLRLAMHDGNMNPQFSDVNLIPDPETNDKLPYYCQTLIEEHEDDLVRLFNRNIAHPDVKLCTEIAQLCQEVAVDDYEEREEL